ncbi:hypothetical protein PCE1_002868 [Barthelona sp. PCE]
MDEQRVESQIRDLCQELSVLETDIYGLERNYLDSYRGANVIKGYFRTHQIAFPKNSDAMMLFSQSSVTNPATTVKPPRQTDERLICILQCPTSNVNLQDGLDKKLFEPKDPI